MKTENEPETEFDLEFVIANSYDIHEYANEFSEDSTYCEMFTEEALHYLGKTYVDTLNELLNSLVKICKQRDNDSEIDIVAANKTEEKSVKLIRDVCANIDLYERALAAIDLALRNDQEDELETM